MRLAVPHRNVAIMRPVAVTFEVYWPRMHQIYSPAYVRIGPNVNATDINLVALI